jgi:Fe-S oxidoreductase
VIHHTQLLQELIDLGKIKLSDATEFKGKRVTYHDSCYLGRANNVYEAPRSLLAALDVDLAEMGRSKKTGMCCGAGGGQMFKEEENGKERINTNRTKEALDTGAEIIVANCPFCTTMLEDGVKSYEKQNEVKVLDIVELLNSSI